MCIYIHTYIHIHMYVCVCIYAYAYMHAYPYAHRDIPVFHVSHTYTAGIDVHICVYIYVCMCFYVNRIYAPRLYTRMLYVYDHVLMHVHALTSSLRAASAPCDTSCATVPARPPSLAMCKAERVFLLSCKDTHTSTSRG